MLSNPDFIIVFSVLIISLVHSLGCYEKMPIKAHGGANGVGASQYDRTHASTRLRHGSILVPASSACEVRCVYNFEL